MFWTKKKSHLKRIVLFDRRLHFYLKAIYAFELHFTFLELDLDLDLITDAGSLFFTLFCALFIIWFYWSFELNGSLFFVQCFLLYLLIKNGPLWPFDVYCEMVESFWKTDTMTHFYWKKNWCTKWNTHSICFEFNYFFIEIPANQMNILFFSSLVNSLSLDSVPIGII